MCNTRYGFTGAYCEEYCSEAIASIFTVVVAGSGALLTAAISLVALWRLHCRNYCCIIEHSHKGQRDSDQKFDTSPKMNQGCNTVTLVLICCLFGSIFMALGVLSNFVVTLGFPWMYRVVDTPPNGPGSKRVPSGYELLYSIAMGLGYTISLSAVVLLPLTWVSFVFTEQFITGSDINE